MTISVTATFTGQAPRTWSQTKAPGERWELNLADLAPMPLVSIHNATVTIECSGWCPVWASIYSDSLKRGTVASHPEVQWGCP